MSIQKFKVNTMLNEFEKWCIIFAVQYTYRDEVGHSNIFDNPINQVLIFTEHNLAIEKLSSV